LKAVALPCAEKRKNEKEKQGDNETWNIIPCIILVLPFLFFFCIFIGFAFKVKFFEFCVIYFLVVTDSENIRDKNK